MSTQRLVNGAVDGTRNTSVTLVPESDEIVNSFPAKPLNIITIWGAARTGKSFFMNALARKDDLFRVTGSMEPCAKGVDLSRTTCSVSNLVAGSIAPSSGGWYSEEPLLAVSDSFFLGRNEFSYDLRNMSHP